MTPSLPQLGLTLLVDADDPTADGFARWLTRQVLLVPVRYVVAGSPTARQLVPDLPAALRRDPIVVVGDDGAVWSDERAWLMCLWATAAHRPLALRLATPATIAQAPTVAAQVAGLAPAGPTGALR